MMKIKRKIKYSVEEEGKVQHELKHMSEYETRCLK